MPIINYILWNPSLEAFSLGPLSIRWYSLCWLIGLLAAYLMVRRQYREQKIGDELFEPLFFYCFIGILVGARLGHCLFYQPDYFVFRQPCGGNAVANPLHTRRLMALHRL